MVISMRKSLPNRKLVRASDAFLPAALMAAAAAGCRTNAVWLFAGGFAMALLSLFSAFGLRAAFASQPAIRAVRGSLACALLLQCLAAVIALIALLLVFPGKSGGLWPFICSGFLLNIEHTFYEYLYAAGDRRGAILCHGLTAALALAGLLLAGERGESAFWIPVATGISAAAAFVIGAVKGGGLKGRLNAQVIRCAPRAALQTALYPAAAAGALCLLRPRRFALAFFAGLMFYELCRTPFRRSPLESKPLNQALACACGIVAAAWIALVPISKVFTWSDEIPLICAMVFLAAVCGFAMFGTIMKNRD